MSKRPTVYDVAALANVSTATVSFTYRKPERVKATTRQLVHDAAHQLGYVPSGSARGLAGGRTGVLGLYSFDLILDAEQQTSTDEDGFELFPLYADEVQHGFELECRSRGYATMLGGVIGARSESIVDIAGRVDGVAVMTHYTSTEQLTNIARRLPVALISQPPNGGLDRIYTDNASGMHQLVQHMVEIHHSSDFVFVGNDENLEIAERYAAFRAELARWDLSESRARPRITVMANDPHLRTALHEYIATTGLPQVFVCAQDQLALALLRTLHDRGIRVPQDTTLTGYDGVVASQLSQPPLTTVRQPMQQLGREAARALIHRLESPDAAPIDLQLPSRLRIRRSCGCD
ncbi:LacI family DNA-binding transcriptional regulator [Microbacterium foliorum]|uniref:HTH-type transcriptional regulator DegA n=1 Tax=Microbacterium foliorum TaxID=104336 RepID=A0A0F0KEI7_9MICO|nr:LacI family DNA-binding transcriptional regulator [Microbacterium foliorum]KJL19263.1 HTH-type transcriptional regulator DegA [Microbacterium foliorum]